MRKIFLLFVAAICCAMSSWASGWTPVDEVPYPQYMTDFSYDEAKCELTFTDNFQRGMNLQRVYMVKAYPLYPATTIYNYISVSGEIYCYGNDNRAEWGTYTTPQNSTGGQTTVNIEKLIKSCYEDGEIDLHLVVAGFYVNQVTDNLVHYEAEAYIRGMELNNCYDIHLPAIRTCRWSSAATTTPIYNNTPLFLEAFVQAAKAVNYTWEFRPLNTSKWISAETNSLSTVEAREGQEITYEKQFDQPGAYSREYRLRVWVPKTDEEVSTPSKEVQILYPMKQYVNGSWLEDDYEPAGKELWIDRPDDCARYDVQSEYPVQFSDIPSVPGSVAFVMPACPVTLMEVPVDPYTVKFVNRDNNCTVLKTEQVACGSDATPPANPTLSGATFTGWSCDFTNVHKDLVVWANYDFGSNYVFEARQAMHLNERYPYMDFAGSDTKAMVGDKITLEADVKTPANASVCFEQGSYDASGNLTWFGEDQFETTSAGIQKTVSKDVYVAWYPMSETENPFQRRVAYRFVVKSSGQTFYSNAFEYDVYYKQTVNASTDMIIFDGEFYWPDGRAVPPARYGDTIFIKRRNGGNECLSMARVNNPSGAFESGLTADGDAFFLCPGQTETINVTVPPVAVIFDGAWPTQQYDFSAQSLGKHNAYYAELSECGGQVLPPADPAEDNMIFKGWQAWSDEYADDAYLRIPSGQSIIGFSAQWEDIPVVTIYTVTFKDWDGTTLKTEEVAEGENATPPAVGGRTGYHFVGWDGSYTTITHDVTLTAQYGEDEKVWTVTFLDWDDKELSVVQVPDGMAAPEPVVVREGFQFQYWMNNSDHLKADVQHVWSNMTVKAYYTSTEGIENVQGDKVQSTKVLRGGVLYIITPDGKIYNASGVRVR